VVGTPVQDVRGGEAVTVDLALEIHRNHSSPPSWSDYKFPFPAPPIASRKGKQDV
jgi:hypothetical protein